MSYGINLNCGVGTSWMAVGKSDGNQFGFMKRFTDSSRGDVGFISTLW